MYKINDERVFYDFAEGLAVVINFSTGMYYGTNLLGSAILDRIVAGNAVDEVVKAVKELPGCPEDIEERMQLFIKQLLEKEIIVKGETVPGGSEALPKEVASDGFELNVEMFAEMSDLLLADPVHDVDAAAGWPLLKEDA